MGRFVHRFEDQSRPLGKHNGAAEAVKFFGQLALATLVLAFLCGLMWMMVTGDSGMFMRVVGHYF